MNVVVSGGEAVSWHKDVLKSLEAASTRPDAEAVMVFAAV